VKEIAANSGQQVPSWVASVAWFSGAFVGSAVLANACIMIGAMLAMPVETLAGPVLGRAVDVAALVLMLALYGGALAWLLSRVAARRSLPTAVWVGLVCFAAVWTVLALTVPRQAVAATPAIVSITGVLTAWVLVGRRQERAPGPG